MAKFITAQTLNYYHEKKTERMAVRSSSSGSMTLEPGRFYDLGQVSSTLTLTFPEGMKKATDGSEAKYIHFRFSLSGSGKIILPSDLMYPRAFTQFSTGQMYEISVCQGFAVIVPFVKKGAS